MAQRRMFSKEVTTSDLFVDMPLSSQLLYFHLGMEADDEGFIGNAKMLSRAYGINNDDLKLLEVKGFIIVFSSGVTVVKDWNLNNKIRKDRQKPTIYTEEKKLLFLDSKGSYQLDNQMTTILQPNDNQMSAQYRVGKESLGEYREGKASIYREHGIPDDNQMATSDLEKFQPHSNQSPTDIEKELDTEKEKTSSIDNDTLFKNYMELFINFAKKNINKRALTLQAFVQLSEMEKNQIIVGAENYINFYKNDRPDDKSGQFSINAYEFLDNAIFKEYQTPIKQNKVHSIFAEYDPNADINDPGGWGPTETDESFDINDRGGW